MSFDLILSSVDREEMEGTISVLKIIALLIFMIYLKRSSVKMLKNYFHLDVCISIIYIYIHFFPERILSSFSYFCVNLDFFNR